MLNRCIIIHTYMVWTTPDDEPENLAGRLLGVLGAKGIVLFVVLVALAVLSWAAPNFVTEPVTGAAVAVALGGAVALDRAITPNDSVDPVGISLFVAAVVYAAVVAVGLSPGWVSAFGVSALVVVATAYGYVRDSKARLDLVGVLVAGTLVAYALLRLTGWEAFAHSPVFAFLVLAVGAGFVAVFARPAVVEHEVETEYDAELHRLLFGVLNDVADVPDEDVREDIASTMRLVAGKLEGVSLPTQVEDSHGGVPVVLPDDSPETRHGGVTADEAAEIADDERFTGYVVHGDAVLLFRNGTLFKHYSDGEFGHDVDSLSDGRTDAAFFPLGHMPLNDLDDLTPTDKEVVTPKEAEREKVESRDDGEGRTLEVGGDEIDMDEMFEKADDIIEDLSD